MPSFSFSIIAILLCCGALPAQETRRALMVAISEYPQGSGWERIHGVNDTLIVVPMLCGFGYPRENIEVLADGQATFAGITTALERLAATTRQGDRVYIHFSCHGQQMHDDNGDEADGLDECIVPYDARRRYLPGVYEGENHLRDDLTGLYVDRIRRAAGPRGSVTVVIDACHSGTGTRYADGEYIRGTSYVFAPPGEPLPVPDPSRTVHSLSSAGGMAPVVVISACRDDEINYEYLDPASGRYYGALTFALGQVLADLRAGMSIPVLERELGRRLRRMFSVKPWEQLPYIETGGEPSIFNP